MSGFREMLKRKSDTTILDSFCSFGFPLEKIRYTFQLLVFNRSVINSNEVEVNYALNGLRGKPEFPYLYKQ